jgi:hypothetical protein
MMDRRALICLFLAAGLVLVADATSAGEISHTIRVSPADLDYSWIKGYDLIRLKDGHLLAPEGEPLLPVKNLHLALPAGARATSIEVVSVEWEDLPGTYRIAPAQPPVPLSKGHTATWVDPDPAVYSSGDFYPAQVVRLVTSGCMAGQPVAALQVYPIQYTPSEKHLRLARSLTVRVLYESGPQPLGSPGVRLREAHRSLLSALVANPADLIPVEHKPLSGSMPLEYLIITSSDLVDDYQPLADWKTRKGVPAAIRTVEWIFSNYAGWDLQESIREYLKVAYQDSGAVWVLLGGDTDIVPCRQAFVSMETTQENLPSDLYYSDLDGTWDANGNHVYGQPEDDVDFYPDLFVGRSGASTPAQIANFIDKVTALDSNPELDYQTKMLFLAGFGDPRTDDAIAKDMIDDWFVPSRFDPIAKLYERDGNATTSACIESLNTGMSIVNHDCHGWTGGIVLSEGNSLSRDDADTLHNAPRYTSLFYTVGCWVGAMDQDCFAEHWVASPDGGGYFVGNSRYGWYTPSMPGYGSGELFDQEFFAALFERDIVHLGKTLADSKIRYIPNAQFENDYRWAIFDLNLFGDPEGWVPTDTLRHLVVNYPAAVPIGPMQVVITVRDASGAAVDGALVCLQCEEDYARGWTDTSGQVSLALNPTHGTYDVTVTGPNCQPYQGAMPIIPNGPFVLYSEYVLSDGSTGNGDGVINPGETVQVIPFMANFGSETAQGVTAVLRPDNSLVTIADSTGNYGDIAPQDTVQCQDTYEFTVDGSASNGDVLHFDLVASSSGAREDWTSQMACVVGAPLLGYVSHSVGGDGAAEPGETVQVMVQLENKGLSPAYNSYALLTSSDSWITIEVDSCGFGDITAGDTTSSIDGYQVNVESGCPVPHFAWLVLHTNCSSGPCGVDSFPLPIGVEAFYDDMESGENGWTHDGTMDTWHLTTHRSHSGSSSWYCGNEDTWRYSNNFTAYLYMPPLAVAPGDELTFWTFHNIEGGMDYAFCEVNDGSGWRALTLITGTISDWVQVELDISPFWGESVQIRFTFYSEDDSYQYEGWYIDDVQMSPAGGIDEADDQPHAAEVFSLAQNAPNPARGWTEIQFTIPGQGGETASHVTLKVYDTAGRLVRTCLDGALASGGHSYRWDGTDRSGRQVAAGVYFYRLSVGEKRATKKMVMLP